MERRNTIQKELVLNAVLAMHRHVTAEEVYACIRKEYPAIGKGTVYRNLKALAEEGKIRKIEVPEGPDRFDFLLHRHYHVRCVRCGELFDVDMAEVPGLMETIRDPHGMLFLDYEVFFRGICANCRQQISKFDDENGGNNNG